MVCADCKTVSAKTITLRCPQCGAEPSSPTSKPAPAAAVEPSKDAAPTPRTKP